MTTASLIVGALAEHRYTWRNETDLHDLLSKALTDAGVEHAREVPLTSRDRIDFLASRVGIEVKVNGSLPTALRQLQRYAHSSDVDELVLVTSVARHLTAPAVIGGKPLHLCSLLAGAL